MVLLSPPFPRVSESSSLIEIRVYGIPAPQGSKTVSRWGGLRESSKAVGPWRTEVGYASRQAFAGPPLSVPVELHVTFYFPRPKSHYGTGRNAEKLKASAPMHCTSSRHGDIDKLCRSTLDGLAVRSGGSVITDDSLVVELICSKQYASAEIQPGALVLIRTA